MRSELDFERLVVPEVEKAITDKLWESLLNIKVAPTVMSSWGWRELYAGS